MNKVFIKVDLHIYNMFNSQQIILWAFCSFIGFILTACDLGPSNVEHGTANQILHIGNSTEPAALDPHIVTGANESNIITALLEGLVTKDPQTLAARPGMASHWKISDNNKIFTFYINSKAQWSNGDPVTADDFVYSWQRVLSPKLASEYAYQLHTIKNAKAFNQGKLSDFKQVGIKAIDAKTLQVELESSTPYFLSLLTHYSTFPVHPPTIERFGKMDERGSLWTRPGNFVGNGPFTLKSWRLNYLIEVEKNPHYWDAGTVKLNSIRFYPIDNELTEERMFRTGALHITNTVPTEKINVYKDNQSPFIQIHPYLGTYFYYFNITKKPFDDQRIRQALSMSIDRQAIVDAVTKGGEIPAYTLTPPDTQGYTSNASLGYNISKARQLLTEAGYPNGNNFPVMTILYNTNEKHRSIALAIQQMWKTQLGIDVKLHNQDWKVYLASTHNMDYDIARGAWVGDYVDPNTFLNTWLTGGGNNHTGWSDNEYDKLIQLASESTKQQQRYQYFQQAEALLIQQSPIMPIYTYTQVRLLSTQVKGWYPNILDYPLYKYIYLATED